MGFSKKKKKKKKKKKSLSQPTGYKSTTEPASCRPVCLLCNTYKILELDVDPQKDDGASPM